MWSSGDVVVVRYRSIDGAFRAARPLTVVEDGDDWLVTYLHPRTTVAVPVLADGRELRDVPLEERWAHSRATALRPWVGGDLVILFPREREFSLWLFRDNGLFRGWYVNLEDRHVRGRRTIDTRDAILDVWVPAETGEPQWKDEHELEAAAAQGRVTADEAERIRLEGERVIAERPWPTGWEDFTPSPSWPVPTLPPGWDATPLETGRLRLTPLASADLAEAAAVYGDATAREHELSTASWQEHGFGFWTVRDRATLTFAGVVEAHLGGPGMDGIEPDEVEIGWIVDEAWRNTGVATEAARAVVRDLFARAGVSHVTALIRLPNEPSRRVAAKLGMRLRSLGRARNGDAAEIYELGRDVE